MAGIAFEIRKILKQNSLFGLFYALNYGIALSAGPIIISIFSILVSGLIAKLYIEAEIVKAFQLIVTYLIAFSLLISSPFQLILTRYIADRYFEGALDRVLPNFLGALFVTVTLDFLAGILFSLFELKQLPLPFRMVFTFTLSLLSGFWLINILFTAFKNYKLILISFIIGFNALLLLTPALSHQGLTGLFSHFSLEQP